MSPTITSALEKQANHEFFAANCYLAMANWCESENYSGFAKFFLIQYGEELAHAKKFIDYMLDRDALPAIGAIAAPPVTFDNLVAVAQKAYDLERANTAGIHACYKAALDESDYATQAILQYFISEQVEEEAWSSKLLGKTKQATCSGSISYLDHHVVKELRGES